LDKRLLKIAFFFFAFYFRITLKLVFGLERNTVLVELSIV